jgi:ApeA N-terminal domain 1/Apea-like HEPN
VIETREFRGWWWLPTQPDNQLPGTLIVTRGQAELDLTGHFGHEMLAETDHEIVMSGRLADQQRILGIDRDGKEVTSEGHQSASYSEHSAGVTISKYSRRITLVGKHFQSGEKIEFDEIAIRASDLTAWTQTRIIETKAKRRKRGRGYVFGDVSARSKQLPDIDIALARGERAFIRFGAKFRGIDIWGRGSEHAELTQDTAFHHRFGRPRDLEYIFERVGDLRNFLSLAVGRPVAILEVTGYRDDFADERTKLPYAIEILWGVPHNPDPPEEQRNAHEMLFTLPAVQTEISKVLRSWFAKQKRLEPVFNLFFGLLYNRNIELDVRFLLYAQAVETYGYRRGRKPVERSFRDQARDVLASCATVSRKVVGNDLDAFTTHLKVTRDFYTHYNPAKESKAAKGVGLLLITVQLRTLIEMALLRELGFGYRAIDAILTRARRYEEIDHFKNYIAGRS